MKTLNLLFAFIFVIVSCGQNPVSNDPGVNFSIHFLKDPTIKIDQLHNLNLSNVKLDPKPWLSSKDIKFYDYSTHFIYLKTSIKDFFPDFNNSDENIEDWHFRPFVVCAFNKACYVGCLHISICSHWRFDVFILDHGIDENDDNDILRIGNAIPSVYTIPQSTEDVRNTTNIKKALIKDGIYHAGLDVKLDDVTIINNSNITTVQYSFSITNNDQDNLYIINSEIIEKEIILDRAVLLLFIAESKQAKRPIGFESNIDHKIYENWKSSWFTKIKSNQTITQTLIRKYPTIPTGHYYCKMFFSNHFIFNKNERMLSDGRYWVGEAIVEPIEIDVD